MKSFKTVLVLSVMAGLAACGGTDSEDAAVAPEVSDPSATVMTLSGELYYLERIALSPGSTAVLELRAGAGPDAQLIAHDELDLGDRQVPIPFELSVDPAAWPGLAAAQFRAGIVSDPGPLRVTQAVELELAPGVTELGGLRLQPVPETAFGAIYACADQTVVFGVLGEHERLVVADEVFAMRAEVSASGARYVAVDGSQTEFWSRGDEATVAVDGEVLPDCQLLRAPALPLRALGHEPSWLILIDDEAIALSTDFGARQLEFPLVEPEISAGGIRFVTETEDSRLTLALDRQPCSDTMANLAYPFRARYSLDGEVGVGCAGAPIEVLVGPEWRIESIGESAIVPGTQPTIEFRVEEGEARFAGLASCNRYMGGFRVTGEGLSFTPAATTLMACADEAQALQEARLTGLLAEVYGFGIDEDGRLVLHTGGGTIVASR